ncbi:MAG: hypothetical protein KKE24_04605 [Candidatus Thermoplasmatota archaeon]|nr:hypothetical protein [Candidatus Thermoplasmatota archaeon]
MKILEMNGELFYPHKYKDEAELQDYVERNFELIFGDEAVWFPGRRIGAGRGETGAKGIPDGFVILLDQKKWIIVEVELASHSLHDHVNPQVSKFSQAWKKNRKDFADRLFKKCEQSKEILEKFKSHRIVSNYYKFIADIVENKPDIAIIIDEYSEELDDLKDEWNFNLNWSIFRAYVSKDGGRNRIIFDMDVIEEPPRFRKTRPGRMASSARPVRKLVFLGGMAPFEKSSQIPAIVANELIKRGNLTKNKIPWGPGKKRYLVSMQPIHPRGNEFFMPEQLNNGWWVEKHASERRQVSLASRLIKHCGLSNDEIRIESM